MLAVPEYELIRGTSLPAEEEDGLQERKAKVRAGAITCKDYRAGWDGGGEGAGEGIEEREIGGEEVEERGWEGMLGCETVLDGQATAAGLFGEEGRGGAGCSWAA